MSAGCDLLLGLIGDNIAASRAPLLHRLAGAQHGLAVRYDRLVPAALGEDFDKLFGQCAARGYRGINVTYPYKERAARKVKIDDPLVRAIGAVNTVIFADDGARGMNTDHSGFIAAYRAARGGTPPGVVCLVGTGGVGRALAFGLVALGAAEIRLNDIDAARAEALAQALRSAPGAPPVRVMADPVEAADGATGLLNGTPVGMVGHAGSVLSRDAMTGAEWAFDAVYTPVDTQFLQEARAAGLEVLSGYELFFYQGVHAWEHFTGLPLDSERLRRDLAAQGGGL